MGSWKLSRECSLCLYQGYILLALDTSQRVQGLVLGHAGLVDCTLPTAATSTP